MKAKTEEEMREEKAPTFNTEKELTQYIHNLVEREHDYGTCVYAMSLAATAAFNYVAHKLGVTGFQASCADMDILRQTRGWEFGRILDYEKLLYPQYCDSEHFPGYTDLLENKEIREWLKREATKKLQETKGLVHPDVIAHWEMLAKWK